MSIGLSQEIRAKTNLALSLSGKLHEEKGSKNQKMIHHPKGFESWS